MSEEEPSGAGIASAEGRRGGPPARAGTLVDGLLERLGVAERVERAGAASDWERLVGPHIARVTVDARVSGRTLFVEVVNAAWLTELNMMRHDFLRRINAGRRRGRIEKIVFLQARDGNRAWRKTARSGCEASGPAASGGPDNSVKRG